MSRAMIIALQAVLEISMHHQVAVERLLQSEDYVFPGEGREVADAIRLSALHLAWHGTLPLFPRRTRTEWWQSWWPWPRRRSPGETEAGTGTETGTVQMAQGGKDGDGVLVDGYLESLEKLQWLDQSGGTADGVSGAGDKGVHSVEDELRHPLLAGYTRSTVEGMRPPPFLLPRAFTLDNEVQVSERDEGDVCRVSGSDGRIFRPWDRFLGTVPLMLLLGCEELVRMRKIYRKAVGSALRG